MANELQVTKEQTARFVNNAMEMEKSIFTLDRAIEDCENKKKEILEEARKRVESVKARKEANEQKQMEARQKLEDCYINQRQFSFGCGFMMFGAIAFALSFIFYGSILDFPEETAIVSLVIGGVVGGILSLIGKLWDNHATDKEVMKKIEEAHQNIDKISEEFASLQAEYNNAIAAQKRAVESANLLDAQKEQLKENRDAISQSLTTCYENNIIKPKYRNIECVVIMNELYQNDRVDTMREAMDKCEVRLFQNEVVRGVHNINSMLGKMVISLAEISSTLESINFNLGMMSQDLFNISDQIAKGQREQQKSNEELIKETKLSRYAAERTAAAATYMEWYGPDRR